MPLASSSPGVTARLPSMKLITADAGRRPELLGGAASDSEDSIGIALDRASALHVDP